MEAYDLPMRIKSTILIPLTSLLLLWLAIPTQLAWGQENVLPTRTDTLSVTGTGPFLIRAFIEESSLIVSSKGKILDQSEYALNARVGQITFLKVDPDSSFTFVASFAYIPLNRVAEYRLWPFAETSLNGDENAGDGSQENTSIQSRKNTNSRLVSRGSVTRGIMTGSNQDATLESGLRLEVEGPITERIRLRASLTDEDSPLLPEGTTQRLDQFDSVFLTFESDNGAVTLGDVDASYSKGQFSKVRRRVQGVHVGGEWNRKWQKSEQNAGFQSTLSASRGTFHSQRIDVLDGIQGPYRLVGKASEQFILILPGTERVYIDGELLGRGLQDDYTIDYATAEITFMPTRVMGAEKRVVVEFQYTTNQFTRLFSAVEADVDLSNGKFRLGVTALRERDGSAFSNELGYNTADSVAVSQSGDADVFRSGAVEVLYNPESLVTQYVRRQDSDGQEWFSVLTQEPASDEKIYRVTFSNVGAGKGDYVRANGSAGIVVNNGIVFKYVGKGLGSYLPVIPLSAPSSKELLGIRLATEALPGILISGEWATSRNDLNVLSSLDSGDDTGYASDLYVQSRPIRIAEWDVAISGKRTSTSKYFSPFDRIREIEFERSWNLEPVSNPLISSINGLKQVDGGVALSANWADSTTVSVAVDRLQIGSVLTANRQRMASQVRHPKTPEIDLEVRRVASEDKRVATSSEWLNGQVSVRSKAAFRGMRPFIEWEGEKLRGDRFALTPQLSATTFNEFRSGLDAYNKYGAGHVVWETRFEESLLRPSEYFRVHTAQLGWEYQVDSERSIQTNVGYRQVPDGRDKVVDSGTALSQESLLLGLSGQWKADQRSRVSWGYQAQSERLARMQELYIRTGPEQGSFVWTDSNEDGVAQLDEFVPETIPGEGAYARTFFPTDSLETVTALVSNIRFVRLKGKSGFSPATWGFRTVLELSEKSRNPKRADTYLLRVASFREPGQSINGRYRLSQEVDLLGADSRVGLTIGWSRMRSLAELASGSQESALDEQSISLTYRSSPRWNVGLYSLHRVDNASASFQSRTYRISGWQHQPEISARSGRLWRITLSPKVSDWTESSRNSRVTSIMIPLVAHYSPSGDVNTRIRLEHARVNLNGPAAGLQLFQLTEGRGKGNSWLWHTSADIQLTTLVSARLSYDGRAPSEGRTVHTGSIQFAARF